MIAYLLAVLAAYRIAHMIALEDGPADVFALIRSKFPQEESWIGRGVNCPLCIGFWSSLAVAMLLPFATWQVFALNWLGVAGAVTVLHLWLEK